MHVKLYSAFLLLTITIRIPDSLSMYTIYIFSYRERNITTFREKIGNLEGQIYASYIESILQSVSFESRREKRRISVR